MEKNFIVIPVFDNPIYCEEAAGKKTGVLEDSLCNKSNTVNGSPDCISMCLPPQI
jgi:hypothetical protein